LHWRLKRFRAASSDSLGRSWIRITRSPWISWWAEVGVCRSSGVPSEKGRCGSGSGELSERGILHARCLRGSRPSRRECAQNGGRDTGRMPLARGLRKGSAGQGQNGAESMGILCGGVNRRGRRRASRESLLEVRAWRS
jgi:hypothetical protein